MSSLKKSRFANFSGIFRNSEEKNKRQEAVMQQETYNSQSNGRNFADENMDEVCANEKNVKPSQQPTNTCLQLKPQLQIQFQNQRQMKIQNNNSDNVENASNNPQLQIKQEKFVTKHKKKIIIGTIASSVAVIAIILTVVLVLVLSPSPKDYQQKFDQYGGITIGQIIVPQFIKYLGQETTLVSHGGAPVLAGGVAQQSLKIVQKNKISVNIPFINLIQIACSAIEQDGNKLIQNQEGMAQFQSQTLKAIQSQLVINGIGQQKIEISQVDSVTLVMIKYDYQNEKIAISKFDEKEEQKKGKQTVQTKNTEDQTGSSEKVKVLDLPKCQVSKAIPEVVKKVKQMIQKHLLKYKQQVDNGSIQKLEKEISDNAIDEQNEKTKQFKQNCLYVESLSYKCKQDAANKIVSSQNQQENKQNQVHLDNPKDQTVASQQLAFVISVN